MQQAIQKAVLQTYGEEPETIEPLGGGFYGRVFLISINKAPFPVVVKGYLFPGLAAKEAEQIKTLSAYSLLKMPEVYHVLEKDKTGFSNDLLFMEALRGINAGFLDVSTLPDGARKRICEQIVDNLIAFHSVVNPKGFGDLSADSFSQSWQDCYVKEAEIIVRKAKILFDKGQISETVLSVFEESIRKFNRIFDRPITKARLIHGDYNTWNIMLDPEKTCAVAVIDPFGCRWADSEFDLYQLDNANGKAYGLLKRYAEKVPLSENFEKKRRFYELYTEINHYYDANITVNAKAAETMAEKLKEVL